MTEVYWNIARFGHHVFRTTTVNGIDAPAIDETLGQAFKAEDGYVVTRYERIIPSWRIYTTTPPDCGYCGAAKLPGQSCGCFDNNCQ